MMYKLLVEEGFVQGGVVWVLQLSCGRNLFGLDPDG